MTTTLRCRGLIRNIDSGNRLTLTKEWMDAYGIRKGEKALLYQLERGLLIKMDYPMRTQDFQPLGDFDITDNGKVITVGAQGRIFIASSTLAKNGLDGRAELILTDQGILVLPPQ